MVVCHNSSFPFHNPSFAFEASPVCKRLEFVWMFYCCRRTLLFYFTYFYLFIRIYNKSSCRLFLLFNYECFLHQKGNSKICFVAHTKRCFDCNSVVSWLLLLLLLFYRSSLLVVEYLSLRYDIPKKSGGCSTYVRVMQVGDKGGNRDRKEVWQASLSFSGSRNDTKRIWYGTMRGDA